MAENFEACMKIFDGSQSKLNYVGDTGLDQATSPVVTKVGVTLRKLFKRTESSSIELKDNRVPFMSLYRVNTSPNNAHLN